MMGVLNSNTIDHWRRASLMRSGAHSTAGLDALLNGRSEAAPPPGTTRLTNWQGFHRPQDI